jgi:DNA (cytosine-5)-methyltransferase 1
MRFIDLFSGLGGFNLALRKLGHECVFASEIDKELVTLYEDNHGISPHGDIRLIDESYIPEHEILCAGFPCQPFSKAGEQKGLACERWGNLFWEIIRIVSYHKPEFILLENVSNLEKHNGGVTWKDMKTSLESEGYEVAFTHLSPHEFGIPQVRKRMFIVARRKSLGTFVFPQKLNIPTSIQTVLEDEPSHAKTLPDHFIQCLEVWQDFLNRFPYAQELPSQPIWAMEFGATYPYEQTTPFMLSNEELSQYRGMFGMPLNEVPREQIRDFLPHHALTPQERFPSWKVNFIKKNRELYARHYTWIDEWLPQIQSFPHSLQKLEWNCKGSERNIWEKIVRFRASGVRVKLPNTAPSLNTIDTQIPIIAWERRYMTMRECARLHGMGELQLPELITPAIRALGNAVNVSLVQIIAQNLFNSEPRNETANPTYELSLSAD